MNASINLFGKTIHLYGVLCVVGITVAVVVLYLLAKKQKFEFFDFTLVIVVTLLSALIGSKLLFVLVSIETIISIFESYPFIEAITGIMQGGFVFYGGLLGGGLGLYIFTKARKESFFKYANLFALVLPLGHAFGRIGCFVAGCCYGMEYNGLLSYTYKSALDISTPIGVSLFPVQLVEAVALLILFAVLMIIYLKAPTKRNMISGIYLVSYAVLRFTLEFLRGDKERGLFLNLSTSQWISLIIISVVIISVIWKIVKRKNSQLLK